MHRQTLNLLGKKNAVWTALERVVKEVPEHEQLFVIWTPTHVYDGGEEGSWGVRSVKFSVPTAEIPSTIMVSDSFHFLPMMTLHS